MDVEHENNPWSWWQDKLAGKPVQMNPSNPQAGFYRMPAKEFYGARRTFKPVAYWWATQDQNGTPITPELCCRIGDEDVSPEKGQGIWERVGNHPVTEEAYRKVAQENGLWPDEHELVRMGDNLPPPDDSFEGLRDAIEPLAREALKRIEGPPIADQDEADKLANLADRLSELHKKADDLRSAERRPHDEACKEIQKRWSPLLMAAESYRNIKYKLLTPWLNKLKTLQEEEAKAAAAAGVAPQASDTRRPRAGTRGRAMSLKSQKRAEIIDYDVCREFFKDSEDMRSTVQMLANRAVRSGVTVPGTKVIEESQAV
jgi:hypothetical protein